MKRPDSDVTILWPAPTRYLCFLDHEGLRHAMVWVEDYRWATACGIALGIPNHKYIPGRLVSHVDLRDIVMGVPGCMLCMMAELEQREPKERTV